MCPMWMFLRNQKHRNIVPQWSDNLQMIKNEQIEKLLTLPNKNYRICPVLSKSANATPRLTVHQCLLFYPLTKCMSTTVKPLYYGHQGDRNKCLYYRGVRFREVGFIWISVSQGPSELSVIERCPYYRGVRKERFHCTNFSSQFEAAKGKL